MLHEFLPTNIIDGLSCIDTKLLNEIRLRTLKPVMVNIAGKFYYLSVNGVTTSKEQAIECNEGLIKSVLQIVSDNSLYSINDQIINGFVTYKNGIRIGVAGEVVTEKDIVQTIKNINGLNIRIPHRVKNCSLPAYSNLVVNGEVHSTLIISAPGAGKTTFLKDFVVQLSNRQLDKSVLVADERGELNNSAKDFGCNVDIYSNCSKRFAFENGIRSLKPDVIVTDEINFNTDLNIIENALTCGVRVIASIHAKNLNELKLKKQFVNILNNQMFTRYVVLNSACGPGTIEGVYNQNLNCIYC